MRIRYNREQDILLLEISGEPIDHAEEVGPIILHLTETGKPVLFEIMDASEVLTDEFLDEARKAIIDLDLARVSRLVAA